jgi:hypothetical protein
MSRRWCLGLAFVLLAGAVGADEGMWTFDNPPTQRLRQDYGFDASKEWLDALRLASVRFNDGGSGSFVSPAGLLLTNHHVGLQCIQNLSSADADYVADGFLAATRSAERACPGYEVNVLLSTEDVTARVLGAATGAMTDKAAAEARKAASARIEQECSKKTGQRCDVVRLYQGGEHHLYVYKKYTDVRLVFAPGEQAAAFGGDPDNFTFPRHDLDVCFFRAYENGKPAQPASYLRWSRTGAAEGDLVFVSGNPGSTSRLQTVAQLEFARDTRLPLSIEYNKGRLAAIRAYASQSPERERRARALIRGLENTLKALEGRRAALQDGRSMERKAADEKALRDRVAADAALAKSVGDPWSQIAQAQKALRARWTESFYVATPASRLAALAADIVRYVAEVRKPNDVRLEEFRDSNLASLENELYSAAPIYDDIEQVRLANYFAQVEASLGKDHPFLNAALQGRSTADVAASLVSGTKIKDVGVRRSLVQGGASAIESSKDPLIELARRIDPLTRQMRTWREDEIDAIVSRAGERLSAARFKLLGKTVYPDATFTLRLSYGTVKAYPSEGTLAAPFTTFHGLYDRAAAWAYKAPWNLEKRYLDRKSTVALETPLNFVSTAEVIGGHSGSPVVDRKGEFVGIIFDSNIHGLALDYFYTDEKARSIAVDARGIVEALRKTYEASALADELTR